MYRPVPPPLAAIEPPPYVSAVQPCFSGDGGRFVRLLINGAGLQLVTFGFYRFWLLTDIRRHLWSATSIDGDALEYLGRARELLIGFLIALAVLAPFFLLYFIAGLEAERYRAFASVPLYLALYLFGQYATYRARRYQLTRTIWRGVRFWMSGSGGAYVLRAALWGLAAILTLGLAYPWRVAALERYKMNNTHYGDLPGRFVGTGSGLAKSYLPLWFIVMAAWGVAAAAMVAAVGGGAKPSAAQVAAIVISFGAAALTTLVAWAIYQATEWRWWIASARLGAVEASSALPRGTFLGLYLKVFGMNLAVGLLIGMVALVVAAVAQGFAATIGGAAKQYAQLAVGAITYLMTLAAFGVIARYFLQHQLWATVINSTTLYNLESTIEAHADGAPVSAFGEGLLEGLDMGGF